MDRLATPPPQPVRATATQAVATSVSASPPTPDVARRIEESRLRAKALRDQRDQREANRRDAGLAPGKPRTSAGFINTDDIRVVGAAAAASVAGRKRPHSSISRDPVPTTNRDARSASAAVEATPQAPAGNSSTSSGGNGDGLRPARKFTKYVDYNFSAMTDTKGGFLNAEDDPWNKNMSAPGAKGGGSGGAGQADAELRPAHMTVAEWERLQLLRKLQRQQSGPFQPGLSVLADEATRKSCRECSSLEIDFMWADVFGCVVCNRCKDKFPDKYSLLTKTECKDDYLLTEPELKDAELLPHLSKPNPHKSNWHDMMLFLRYQVEEYAFKTKWGSAEALDAEFERREADKRRRKEAKFKEKLLDLKRKTRTDAYRRNNPRSALASSGAEGATRPARFGDAVAGNNRKHAHEWGRAVENEKGETVKTCTSCGMEVEELEF